MNFDPYWLNVLYFFMLIFSLFFSANTFIRTSVLFLISKSLFLFSCPFFFILTKSFNFTFILVLEVMNLYTIFHKLVQTPDFVSIGRNKDINTYKWHYDIMNSARPSLLWINTSIFKVQLVDSNRLIWFPYKMYMDAKIYIL